MARLIGLLFTVPALALLACGSGDAAGRRPLDIGVGPDAGREVSGDDGVSGDADGEGLGDAAGTEAVAAECLVDGDCIGKVPGSSPCEVVRCLSGRCVPRTADDGTPCDDGDPCTMEETCKDGKCSGSPVDCDDGNPCTDDSCAGGCVHLPNSAPCDDLDACTTGDRCREGACTGVPVTCDEDRPSECDGDLMVTYGKPGVCVDGSCEYPEQVVLCPQGCANGKCVGDPCEWLDCSTPPGECFGSGTCRDGRCEYPYLDDGTACSDGRACTMADTCAKGVCAGTPVVCRTPPPSDCLDARTLRVWRKEGTCVEPDGTCAYQWDLSDCPRECADGVCVESVGILGALTSGGLLGMTSADRVMACVMPGWEEPLSMKSTTYRLTAGFEPW